jgi:hypothetical protein
MAALAIQAHGHGLPQRHGFSCSPLPLRMHLSLAYPPSLRKCPAVPTALFWGERQSSKRVTPRPSREQFVISAEHLSQQVHYFTSQAIGISISHNLSSAQVFTSLVQNFLRWLGDWSSSRHVLLKISLHIDVILCMEDVIILRLT